MNTQSEFSGMKYRLFTSLWLVVFTLLLLLSGCGGGSVDAPETGAEEKPLVSSMITNVDTHDSVPDSEISKDVYGRRIARTKMMIVFKPDATAEEAFALLSDIDATITSSLEGARSVVVRIPDPGTLDAYDAIVSDIEDRAFVDFVMKGEMPGTTMLPAIFSEPPATSELPYIDHHLAVHAHAAWNARNAIRHSPQVLIADNFGDGAPTHNSINYTGIIYNFSNTTLDSHGYHVLGILAGIHGAHYTTGIFPDTINLHAIDGMAGLDWSTTLNRILQILSSNPGKWVVNTSIGYEVCTGINGHCTKLEKARKWASTWIEEVRRLGLESRVLHVAAAGNIETPPGINIRDAETDSTFASARLLSGLTDALGNPLPNLTNTLIIENAVNTVVDPNNIQPVKTKCLSVNSFVGGDLAAIGEDVWSYIDAIGNQGGHSGSSMAVPEVAGLAAYLWSIDSSPSAQQILNAIYANSRPVPVVAGDPACSDWAFPAPVIDAYAALLSLDATSTPTPANSPVRLALLDVNDDGEFEGTDLALFIDQYFDTSTTPPVPREPAAPDYGRYDLNGDGWTGSDYTTDFDLDRTGSIQYGPAVLGNVTQNIEGDSINFDENSLTDMQILCYYAYSPLYTGDSDARQRIMGPVLDRCGKKALPKRITHTVPGTAFGPSLIYEYTYDDQGNLIQSVTTQLQQGSVSSQTTTVYTYDENGHLTYMQTVGNPTGCAIQTDSYGNITLRSCAGGLSVNTYTYTYNSDGSKASEIETSTVTLEDGSTRTSSVTILYDYDADGRLIERTLLGGYGSDVYEYDSQGFLVRESHFDDAGVLWFYYLYVNDSYGNPLTKTYYDENDIVRSIIQYEY